jgi:hypothetical protein
VPFAETGIIDRDEGLLAVHGSGGNCDAGRYLTGCDLAVEVS